MKRAKRVRVSLGNIDRLFRFQVMADVVRL